MDHERIGKVAKLLSSHMMAIGKKKKEKNGATYNVTGKTC